MVSQLDNDTINVASRSNHNLEGHLRPLSPGEQLIGILQQLAINDEELSHWLQKDQIDVDIHLNDSGASGVIQLTDQLRVPIMITDIIATWNTGSQQTQVTNNPAAGANFVYVNNTGAPQQLLAFSSTFTTDAVVANRFVSYQITDSLGHILAQDVDGTAIPASTTVQMKGYLGGTQVNSSSGNVILPLPQNLLIPVGGQLLLNASNIDPGDQWSSVILTFGTGPTVVTLQIDDRIFEPNPASGIFALSSMHGMQLPMHKIVKLTTLPAAACHFSILGYADPRKVDRL